MAPVAWIANFQSWCSWIIQEPQASLTPPLVSIGSFSTKRENHLVYYIVHVNIPYKRTKVS